MTAAPDVTCVVQARAGSTRLPGKVLADLAGRPMLRYMLDRLARLDGVTLVLATSDLAQDDAVATVGESAGVCVVRGAEADVLDRFRIALEEHPADTVVRLTGDCPLVDPVVVVEVLDLHASSRADYTSNVLPRTFPKGLDVEVLAARALEVAAAEAATPSEREHVTPYLYRRPERFRLANLRSGEELGRERWTVDTPEDLEFVRGVVEALGPDRPFRWRDVLAYAGTRAPADAIVLRPADEGDSELVLAWRNDPTSVAWSRSGGVVAPADHERWYRRRLADPGTPMSIGELDGAPIGSLRVDVREGVGSVSIAVAPGRRGRGLGKRLLAALVDQFSAEQQVTTLEACVHRDNAASLRAFKATGFSERRDDAAGFVILSRQLRA